MSDWDAEPVHSSNRPGNDVYNGKTSSNLDFSTLKLDVERVQFKWNVRTSCYEPMSEGGGEEMALINKISEVIFVYLKHMRMIGKIPRLARSL